MQGLLSLITLELTACRFSARWASLSLPVKAAFGVTGFAWLRRCLTQFAERLSWEVLPLGQHGSCGAGVSEWEGPWALGVFLLVVPELQPFLFLVHENIASY